MEYKIIDKEHKNDINLKNEPFSIYGRMVPKLEEGKWSYSIQKFSEEDVTEMTFPDENYDYEKMVKNHTFIGAYDGDKCVGLAILADGFLNYMYLDDLKVSQNYRKHGIGKGLIKKSLEVAISKKYGGVYTVGQDNNLTACKFYLSVGFKIGGFDNHVYQGTPQENKADILFYLDK